MTNICLYLHSIKNAGGAEKRITSLANYLSKYNYNVFIMTWDRQEDNSFYKIDKKIKWIKVEYKYGYLNKIKNIIKVIKFLKNKKIVIFIGFVMSGFKTLFIACKFSNTKIIVAERNSPSMYKIKFNFISRIFIYINLFLSTKIVVQLNEYIKHYPLFLRKRIYVIENYIPLPNLDTYKESKKENKFFKILLVSRLDNEQKNLDKFIFSLSKINSKYLNIVRVTIIGHGKDYQVLLNLIDKLNLHSIIKIITPKTNDLSHFYSDSDLFVIPSKWEGVSNSLIEAMSYGLPIIALKECQGMGYFVKNSYNGYLVDTDSQSVLLDKYLYKLIDEKEFCIQLGINSYKLIKSINKEDDRIKWRDLIENSK